MNRALCYLWIVLALLVASGASCPGRRSAPVSATPVFSGPPSLEQVVEAVNANSRPIQQLQTESATLSVSGLPALRANLALDRPRRFRLRAELTQFTGPELDLGSNDSLFWMWVKRNQPPAVYYARHEEFGDSRVRQLLPVEPHWLIEALGLVSLDPTAAYEGPYERGPGQVEIRSRMPTAEGSYHNKTLVVDDTYGWVLEQHVYDAQGRLLASAKASKHRFYPRQGVTLPQRIEIQLPPAQMAFQMEIGGYLINQVYGEPAQLWAFPQLDGYPLVNLASFSPPSPASPSQNTTLQRLPPPLYRQPHASYRPRVRGD